MTRRSLAAGAACLLVAIAVAGCDGSVPTPAAGAAALIPAPTSAHLDEDTAFRWPEGGCISAPQGASGPAEYLADLIVTAGGPDMSAGSDCPIALQLDGEMAASPQASGTGTASSILTQDAAQQGYRVTVTTDGVTLNAPTAAGLYSGAQTLAQLALLRKAGGDSGLPTGTIEDRPAYAYRGFMLDVTRRFYPVAEVQRIIDNIALYHINALHLHLSDDQGWRLAVDALPALTEIGATTQVGWPIPSGRSWYYSAADYRQIVEYAASRGLEVIPEFEGPGHVTALQASLPQLTCDGEAPDLYAGTSVGISQLCLDGQDHVSDLDAALTAIYQQAAQEPGHWIHIGGDETPGITREQKRTYVTVASQAAQQAGRSIIAWHDLGRGGLPAGSAIQMWAADPIIQAAAATPTSALSEDVAAAVAAGAGVIMSPASHTYIDHKYAAEDTVGYEWAGIISVRNSYVWDPAGMLTTPDGPMLTRDQVWGVEAALFSEASVGAAPPADPADLMDPGEYADRMVFPRLPAIAEVGWVGQGTPAAWEGLAGRLSAQAGLWDTLGVGYYRTPEIWKSEATNG